MNLRYAKRSEDTEQINVASWAAWNERQYPELNWKEGTISPLKKK